MFRIPGTINTKARDRGVKNPYVRVIKGYQYAVELVVDLTSMPYDFYIEREASRPTTKLLNDFYLYLMQQKIDNRLDDFARQEKRLWQSLEPNKNKDNNVGVIPWIEKILQIGVEDQRKDLLFWVLAPYLITIKRLDYEQAFDILDSWLAKCSQVRRLEPTISEFHRRNNYRLKRCADKLEEGKPWWPISLETFQEYYPDLYKEVLE
jgi:hypothetical protein